LVQQQAEGLVDNTSTFLEVIMSDRLHEHTSSAAASSGGRLWQDGRFVQNYDRLGPCLGSGGMGSVWAAHVAEGTVSSGGVGGWVAVKAILLGLANGDTASLHNGLRECLSTFRDLSLAHVVRYEDYWLEDLTNLPAEVRQRCGPGQGLGASSHIEASPPAPLGLGRTPEATIHSLRFREDGIGIRMLCRNPSFPPCSTGSTPIGFGESCGFVWESNAGVGDYLSWTQSDGSEAQGLSPRGKTILPTQRLSTCMVLLIEKELMCPPPLEEPRSNTNTLATRLTLRAWLQHQDRTYADAAAIFGPLMLSVRHIHRKRIVHADLKPDNIFCVIERSKVAAVRIGDFGLAGENQLFREFDPFSSGMLRGGASRLIGGTPGYAAPEILLTADGRGLNDCCYCSDKVDIFACAVMLLELLLPPFRTQMERVTVLQQFHNEKTAPDFIIRRLPKTWALLSEMGDSDPARRLSAEEVCKIFERVVRKELCRSSVQLLHSLSMRGGCSITLIPPDAMQGRGHSPADRAPNSSAAGSTRRGARGRKGRRRG